MREACVYLFHEEIEGIRAGYADLAGASHEPRPVTYGVQGCSLAVVKALKVLRAVTVAYFGVCWADRAMGIKCRFSILH